MGFRFLPTVNVADEPEEWWQQYKTQRAQYLSSRRVIIEAIVDEEGQPVERIVELEDEIETPAAIVVVESARTWPLEQLGSSPRKFAKLALETGAEVIVGRAIADFAPVLFLNDSKEGVEPPHKAGDVRYQGFTLRTYSVAALWPTSPISGISVSGGPLRFQVSFSARGPEDGKAGFESATAFDPRGIETPLTFDYTPDKIVAKRRDWTEAQRLAEGVRLNRLLNTPGDSWRSTSHYYSQSKPFEAWLRALVVEISDDRLG